MAKVLVLLAVLVLQVFRCTGDETSGTPDGMEEWGYLDVREGAHMFWWLYYSNVLEVKSTPIVFWLQGGPGASGVGFGNFDEIGPISTTLEKRESTWLKVAHLLFVDNPVGTGYSYVDDENLLCTTNKEVVDDLVSFVKTFFNTHEALKQSPFYIVAESYGGKFASEFGVAIQKNLKELDFNFKGVALGDTWISPIDFLYAWGPLLKSFSLVDESANARIDSYAVLAASEMQKGNFLNATYIWGDMEEEVLIATDNVDFYNLLKHESNEELQYSSHKSHLGARLLKKSAPDPLTVIMNGPIREKLGIIPNSVQWSQSSGAVFGTLSADFMLDTIDKVDELLALGVKVTIYSGQLDLICCTTGTEAWVQKLKWPGLAEFNRAERKAISCDETQTSAFVKQHENLTFYWIMNAGHMVPTDNPCMASKMLKLIIEEGSKTLPSTKKAKSSVVDRHRNGLSAEM
ncbi:serine carboxypeptidase 1 [Marchantia polymorpha subsp. ruderalis]|uniref:Carboxypeptidase n=2 Tax=Marchantia polymorpha TaxID=3197 RepID=A0AAF6BZ03_MARPO|nr:hypothetical protein MARPO_0003s0306 [Marchantia polymorpha]PTQ49473.1 hypothetical protein MARPO_0003s0306 [Marchantia polymorpha]BBN17237.1 hypothetical protein Mp_7g12980 [Marchantia polymorpha subsp. ruderalis]BBN17238.1 hypothetical protein Mp_7g12980 [Marchantia polymorpha subsp. ruderalis]|eukprot:PTQ49472.1 hypothetical protein MARPO_0003s0306 [Marchantia polymorpha]